jgi:hypothetical protein
MRHRVVHRARSGGTVLLLCFQRWRVVQAHVGAGPVFGAHTNIIRLFQDILLIEHHVRTC